MENPGLSPASNRDVTRDAEFAAERRPWLDQIRAYQGGDESVLEQLFATYYPIVRRVVCRRLGRRNSQFAEVEDVAQDALLRALRGLAQFEPRSEAAFRCWLARIVQSRITDRNRHDRARKRGAGKVRSLTDACPDDDSQVAPAAAEPNPSEIASGHELERACGQALLQLSPVQRELINLRDNRGMTYGEIAAELSLGKIGTARMACLRARKKLRLKIRAMGFEPAS